MLTIRDILIAPFEIDVDRFNFTLVQCGVSQEGNPQRKVIGYYHTLEGAMRQILQAKVAEVTPDMDGKVVSLKEFLHEQAVTKQKLKKWMSWFASPAEFNEDDDIPTILPKEVCKRFDKNADDSDSVEAGGVTMEFTNTTDKTIKIAQGDAVHMPFISRKEGAKIRKARKK